MSSLRAAFARERTAAPGCTIYVWLVGGRASLTDPWVSGVRLVPGGVRSPCVWPWGFVPFCALRARMRHARAGGSLL